uniref:hypothetical protein n=1 Tax=Agathobacter sp. TaxID=2021311 RepID=UPI0040572A7F
MFPFLIIFLIFIALLTYYIRKNSNTQQKVIKDFLDKEQAANHTRKQDISNLDYIAIPWEKLPKDIQTPSKNAFWALYGKPILNLTGISNTDLKLRYGIANLETLSEYDSNFMEMVSLLPTYAEELMEQGYVSQAKDLLEFGISCNADSRKIYFLLADIYARLGETDKLPLLIEKAQSLPELTKQAVISQLSSLNL